MRNLKFAVFLTFGLFADLDVFAATNTVVTGCHGCSDSEMARAAMRTTGKGEAYVFNQDDETAKAYSVYFDYDDSGGRGRATKVVDEMSVDKYLRKKFKLFAQSANEIDGGTFELPPDSPIRSAAGAALDRSYSESVIEDHLSGVSLVDRALSGLDAVLNELYRSATNMTDVVKRNQVTIRFPDGSTEKYTIVFTTTLSSNGQTVIIELDIEDPDDASGQGGTGGLPTRDRNFDGFEADNSSGSVWDYVDWAASHGINVTGDTDYSACPDVKMECSYQGSEIMCIVDASEC